MNNNNNHTITINTSSTDSPGMILSNTPVYDFSSLAGTSTDTITVNTDWNNSVPVNITGDTSDLTFTTTGLDESLNYINKEQVETMCEEYPALSIAYDNFRNIYDMVIQDWKGKQND